MNLYHYSISIEADSEREAAKVLYERLAHDEDYGFPYRLVWCGKERDLPDAMLVGGFLQDLDGHGLTITDPQALEARLRDDFSLSNKTLLLYNPQYDEDEYLKEVT